MPSRCCWITMATLAIVATVAGCVVALVVIPAFAQKCVNQGTITLLNATMYAPHGKTLMLNATIRLDNGYLVHVFYLGGIDAGS